MKVIHDEWLIVNIIWKIKFSRISFDNAVNYMMLDWTAQENSSIAIDWNVNFPFKFYCKEWKNV